MLQKYLRFLEKNQLLQHETPQLITLDEFTFKNFIQGGSFKMFNFVQDQGRRKF